MVQSSQIASSVTTLPAIPVELFAPLVVAQPQQVACLNPTMLLQVAVSTLMVAIRQPLVTQSSVAIALISTQVPVPSTIKVAMTSHLRVMPMTAMATAFLTAMSLTAMIATTTERSTSAKSSAMTATTAELLMSAISQTVQKTPMAMVSLTLAKLLVNSTQHVTAATLSTLLIKVPPPVLVVWPVPPEVSLSRTLS